MSQALYRKWRPARFDQVVGQEHITSTLKNAVAAGRLGHAYLFSGPRGTGKTTVARLVAKAVNCQDDDLTQRPCNTCPPCIAVNDGRYLDLIEIDAASNTGVDDIRDLREKINFAPSEGRFKVYIIDEVHMLSTAAFNALLKTLEEPPDHAMFILATTEEHKVPLTIKSRCQQFNFRLLTGQEITGRIRWLADQESLTLEEAAVTMIAQHASGSIRDAESLLDQLFAGPDDQITLERARMVLGTASTETVSTLTDSLLTGDGPKGLSIIHEALGTGTDARQFSRQMVSYLRHLLLTATAGHELPIDLTEDQQATMNRQARAVNRAFLIEAVKGFNTAAHIPTGSWQPQLPLELAFIELLPASADPVSSDRRIAPPIERQNKPNPVEASIPESAPAEAVGTLAETAVASEETVIELKGTGSEPEETGSEPEETGSEPEEIVSKKEETLGKREETVSESQETGSLVDTTAGTSLDSIKTHWPELRERVGKRDTNLPALLASSKPLATEGSILILGFDYPILKEKFERKKEAKEIVATELSELLQSPITVRTVVTEQYVPPATPETIDIEEFSALAQELGGVVHNQ